MVGDMLSMIAMVGILAGIIKLFQMAATLGEIKELLSEIKRNTQDYSPAAQNLDRRPAEPTYRHIDSTSEADAIIRASMLEPER